MAILSLQNEAVRIEVDPSFGARVLSLVDRRSGRDWMAKGPQSAQVGEDAVYLADEAVGWDECFPTVSPWDASGTAFARPLRDHGDLWGRPWTIDAHSPASLTLSRADSSFRFTRRLSLAESTLTADYTVENVATVPMPFMWALHGLLAVTPDDRIEMAGVDAVQCTYLSLGGKAISAHRLHWPGPDEALDLPLDAVQPVSTHLAAKLYASNIPTAKVSVGGRNGWLDIGWNKAEIAHLGIWFNYGGWPETGDVHHIALEPTTAPADHLGQALEQGNDVTLAPGAAKRWSIAMTLRAPISRS